MEAMRNKVASCIFLFFIGSVAGAATRLADYTARIERARAAVGELIEREPSENGRNALIKKLAAIKRLVPKQEEVEFDGRVVRVENTWLHNAIDEVVKEPGDDGEGRKLILNEITDRLSALQERVRQSQLVANSDDKSAQLNSILARPEYRSDEEKASSINRLIKRMRDAILRFLESLALRSGAAPNAPSLGLLSISRVVLVFILLAAAIIGAIKLLNHLHLNRGAKASKDLRQVLGEEIDADLTASDLMAKANELAVEGDFRTAIRRVYIALLLELEMRGKLPLHPAKTNRDYLNDMRSQPEVFMTFSTMTGAFERTWYGERGATEEEYSGFVSEYDKTVGSRQ
jgi:uncharacterized protein DUF4129